MKSFITFINICHLLNGAGAFFIPVRGLRLSPMSQVDIASANTEVFNRSAMALRFYCLLLKQKSKSFFFLLTFPAMVKVM